MDKKEIGHKISTTRKRLGITQKELAEKLHVSDKTVSKWETGTHFPDITIMEELATTLEIDVVELLGLENASADETINKIAVASIEEKNIIAKQIQKRGWITVIIGLILSGGMIYTSKVLADNGLFGLCQVFTMGMLGFTGIIMANGMISIRGGKKLQK